MSTIPTTSAAELEFQRWMKERVSHFEWFAEKMLPQTGIGAKRLVGAMRYSLLGGGKRIRPLLCYAAGTVSGAPEEVLDRAALALEMIHSYSLVHDDMPSMDNDTLRRGRATTHVRYGEAMAMLAGDALQTEAFTVLSSPSVPPEAAQRLVQTLARAAGVWGMCGGQALDLEMVGQKPGAAELSRMQAMKTGAMIMAAVLMGAQSGIWTALGDQAKAGLGRLCGRPRRGLPSRGRYSRLHAGYDDFGKNRRQRCQGRQAYLGFTFGTRRCQGTCQSAGRGCRKSAAAPCG